MAIKVNVRGPVIGLLKIQIYTDTVISFSNVNIHVKVNM